MVYRPNLVLVDTFNCLNKPLSGRSVINTIKSCRFQRSSLVVAISGALTLMCAGAAFAQQAPTPAADAAETTD